jgi:hypothetical protein
MLVAHSNQNIATTTHKALRIRERRAMGTFMGRPAQTIPRWTTTLLHTPGMALRGGIKALLQPLAHPIKAYPIQQQTPAAIFTA